MSTTRIDTVESDNVLDVDVFDDQGPAAMFVSILKDDEEVCVELDLEGAEKLGAAVARFLRACAEEKTK